MIKILPYHSKYPCFSEDQFDISGSTFTADSFVLRYSSRPNISIHKLIDERLAYIRFDSITDKDNWTIGSGIYDFIDHSVLDDTLSESDIIAKTGEFEFCYAKSNNCSEEPKPTLLIDHEGEVIFSSDEYFGYIKFDSEEYVCLKNYSYWVCINKRTREVQWTADLGSCDLIHSSASGGLLYFLLDEEDVSVIRLIDLKTGEIIRDTRIPYLLDVKFVDKNTFTFSGYRNEDKWFTVNYDIEGDSYEAFPRPNRTLLESLLGLDYCYSFTDYADLGRLVIEDPSIYDETFIRRYATKTGDLAGEIYLPDVRISNQAHFFKTSDNKYGAIAESKGHWPDEHKYIVLWDERDFGESDPEVFKEDLFFSTERIHVNDDVCYQVSVPEKCENYFQLHRQLSVGLYKAAALHGYKVRYADKEFDSEFSGKIICDVSNHSLIEQEAWAIKHLCKHIESDLEWDAITSPYDPAEKITIEAKLS